MLLEIAAAWQSRIEEELKVIGLSRTLYTTLAHLAGADRPLTQKELADAERCAASNITQKIDRLEKEGLVRRIADPTDRRSILAEPTPLGRERASAGSRILARLDAGFTSSISEDNRTILAETLATLK
jgi:DNA-binding MarR family transcriptional regulator